MFISCLAGMHPCNTKIQREKKSSKFIVHEINPKNGKLAFYWKDQNNNPYKTFDALKAALARNNKTLQFAMNGGMFLKDYSPQGLYIENGQVLREMDTTQTAYGNFYMQPNGIFLLHRSGRGQVIQSSQFAMDTSILYATQSGPLLVIDSAMHPKFNHSSSSTFIRNGVGILPNGNILFIISKEPVNFHASAQSFLEKGCRNALYLDGFVSRCYLPEQDVRQMDGNFGVIIAQTK